jgi:anti-sigma regulatory factor (Ser/Thr protein kinase)
VEVRSPIAPEEYENLRRFVELCHEHGFIKVRIRYARSLPTGTVTMLRDLKKRCSSISVRLLSGGKPTKKSSTEGAGCEGEGPDNRGHIPVEYVVRLSDFQHALDRINSIVLLIGLSIPLDERCLSHLEFCLHELVANTVEHAAFTADTPEIQVRMTARPDSVHIAYRDNADPFQPSDRLEVDISDRIKEGKKRGFGIFLLHQIADAFTHGRVSKWNNITFRIKRNLQPQEA